MRRLITCRLLPPLIKPTISPWLKDPIDFLNVAGTDKFVVRHYNFVAMDIPGLVFRSFHFVNADPSSYPSAEVVLTTFLSHVVGFSESCFDIGEGLKCGVEIVFIPEAGCPQPHVPGLVLCQVIKD